MDRNFYFRDVADEDDDDDISSSLVIPVEDITGIVPTAITTLDLYYKMGGKAVPSTDSANGKVTLTVTRGKLKEVCAAISAAANGGTAYKGITVIADDVTTDYDGSTRAATYIHPDITACSITTG